MTSSTSESSPQSAAFLALLSECGSSSDGGRQIADFLRSTTAALADLGVYPVQGIHDLETEQWVALRRCMSSAKEEDALLIFQVMAAALVTRPISDSATLMMAVFQCPWRLQAIEMAPGFFLKTRTEKSDGMLLQGRQAANAFQALACSSSHQPLAQEYARETLRALKAIGVQDFPNPDDGVLCLQEAAYFHEPDSLKAFVDEFPQGVDAIDRQGGQPLHMAAMSTHAGNVKVLLDAGVEPRPVSHVLDTPMKQAARNNRFENVLVLIDTGAYCLDDVKAAGKAFDSDKAEHLEAYHAAVMARMAVGNAASGDLALPKPL